MSDTSCCPRCGARITGKDAAIAHKCDTVYRDNQNTVYNTFICTKCHQKYPSAKEFAEHPCVREMSPGVGKTPDGMFDYVCVKCKNHFKQPLNINGVCKACEAVAVADVVNHPPHYTFGKYEVIDVIRDWGLIEGFALGNAIKYIARSGKKDPTKQIEDLKKARFYLDYMIKHLETKGE